MTFTKTINGGELYD